VATRVWRHPVRAPDAATRRIANVFATVRVALTRIGDLSTQDVSEKFITKQNLPALPARGLARSIREANDSVRRGARVYHSRRKQFNDQLVCDRQNTSGRRIVRRRPPLRLKHAALQERNLMRSRAGAPAAVCRFSTSIRCADPLDPPPGSGSQSCPPPGPPAERRRETGSDWN